MLNVGSTHYILGAKYGNCHSIISFGTAPFYVEEIFHFICFNGSLKELFWFECMVFFEASKMMFISMYLFLNSPQNNISYLKILIAKTYSLDPSMYLIPIR